MSNDRRADISATETPAQLIAHRLQEIRVAPVELLPISSIQWDESPRLLGEDDRHVQLLAEVEPDLPPIVVHRNTMKVVDGIHRVHAALQCGRKHIKAHFFEGDVEEAFLFSVLVNTANGLPLSLDDRDSAAQRILTVHPEWSDRAIAAVAGISGSRVANLRRQNTAGTDTVQARIGRDGRARPVSCAQGRRRASELIKSNPAASLRQIAAEAGISPATAADVRKRLSRGVDPVPDKQRREPQQTPGITLAAPQKMPPAGSEQKTHVGLLLILNRLRRDPSLRFNQTGRDMLRLFALSDTAVREQNQIVTTLPPHCLGPLAELMHGYAEIWKSLGDALDQASKSSATGAALITGDARFSSPVAGSTTTLG